MTVPGNGRDCGACALCCKLLEIREIGKPQAQWCPHCVNHARCGIYERRPGECRTFNCEWLLKPEIGDEWRPTRSKMVLFFLRDGDLDKLVVHVDPGAPLAWRNEPYYSQLKRWAENLAEHNGTVNIYARNRVTIVLPDDDIDLGVFEPGDTIALAKRKVGDKWQMIARKVPRGTALSPG